MYSEKENMKVNSKSEQSNPKILRNIIALQLFANANSYSFSCLITWRLYNYIWIYTE